MLPDRDLPDTHTEQPAPSRAGAEIGVVKCWADLVAVARARSLELDVSFQTIDELAGLADNYTSKLLSGERQFAEMSFDAVFGALGLDFVAVESREKMRRIEKRLVHRKTTSRMHSGAEQAPIKFKLTRKFMRKIARLSVAGRLRRLSPAQRSEIARKAALARWEMIRERKRQAALAAQRRAVRASIVAVGGEQVEVQPTS